MTIRLRVGLGLIASAAVVLLTIAILVFIGIPQGLSPRVYWLLGSRHYKKEVLTSADTTKELPHVEWDGDGWGGTPVGDWMGYVVFDPKDSLPLTSTQRPPMRIAGVPCEVVAVRRLEQNWYSIVTNMNQFLDVHHPDCGGYRGLPRELGR